MLGCECRGENETHIQPLVKLHLLRSGFGLLPNIFLVKSTSLWFSITLSLSVSLFLSLSHCFWLSIPVSFPVSLSLSVYLFFIFLPLTVFLFSPLLSSPPLFPSLPPTSLSPPPSSLSPPLSLFLFYLYVWPLPLCLCFSFFLCVSVGVSCMSVSCSFFLWNTQRFTRNYFAS